jgi:small subunit ribosomal protein S5
MEQTQTKDTAKKPEKPNFAQRRRGGFSQSKTPAEQPEYEQKLLDVRRTARMAAGGRRFSFRAVLVIGNKKGKVGVGVAKGADVTMAVDKAVRQAKKKLIEVPITENGSIAFLVEAKFSAAKVMLKPAAKGRGVIAGGTVRTICNLAGINNITAKILGKTNNKLNNARATLLALQKLK